MHAVGLTGDGDERDSPADGPAPADQAEQDGGQLQDAHEEVQQEGQEASFKVPAVKQREMLQFEHVHHKRRYFATDLSGSGDGIENLGPGPQQKQRHRKPLTIVP